MLYLVIIVLVLLYLITNEKEGFVEYTSLNIGTNGGVPTYSSPNAVINWLGMSDLEYSKAVTKLQGKDQSVTIRNLV
jgi:hypothetical protein